MRRSRLSAGYVNDTRLRRELRRERMNSGAASTKSPSVAPDEPTPDLVSPPSETFAQATKRQKSAKPRKKREKQEPKAADQGLGKGLLPDLEAERDSAAANIERLENELFAEREKLRALDTLLNTLNVDYEPVKARAPVTLIKRGNVEIEDAVFHVIKDD